MWLDAIRSTIYAGRKAMTITIDLTPTEEAQLIQAAKQEGMEPDAEH